MPSRTGRRARAMATPPPAPAKPVGEPVPLSHATAIALQDLAQHHQLSVNAAAEYAIGLYHWISSKQREGFTLCMADPNNDVHAVELPPATP